MEKTALEKRFIKRMKLCNHEFHGFSQGSDSKCFKCGELHSIDTPWSQEIMSFEEHSTYWLGFAMGWVKAQPFGKDFKGFGLFELDKFLRERGV